MGLLAGDSFLLGANYHIVIDSCFSTGSGLTTNGFLEPIIAWQLAVVLNHSAYDKQEKKLK